MYEITRTSRCCSHFLLNLKYLHFFIFGCYRKILIKLTNILVNNSDYNKLKIEERVNSGLILLTTFPDEQRLLELSKTLIKNRLCACVNYTKVNSLYMWKNDLKQEKEFLAVYKTTSESIEQLKSELLNKHPYDIPEVVVLSMKDVSRDYLGWLIDNTGRNSREI